MTRFMIRAKNLVKNYGSFRAVDDISLNVEKGEILGFLGPNGAGKSTTMKLLTGFLRPDSGSASLGGFDVHEESLRAKTLLGYLPENGPLYPEMTVREFLVFSAKMRSMKAYDIELALERCQKLCQLTPVMDQTIETLSKGFRQRVGMAQAILHNPSCLVLDEPTDGLDPNQKREVRRLIHAMSRDAAIIISTHVLEEVEAMCNRVIIITEGKVVFDGTTDELRHRHPYYNAVYIEVLENDLIPVIQHRVEQLRSVAKVESCDGYLRAIPRKGLNPLSEILKLVAENDWHLTRVGNVPIRLDDVFSQLTEPKSEK
jgi:ABC-2 type transport system ATP-binding protein